MRVFKVTVDESAKDVININSEYVGIDDEGKNEASKHPTPANDCGELVFKLIKAADIPDNAKWIGHNGVLQKYGNTIKKDAIEVSAYQNGKFAGRVYSDNFGIDLDWLDACLDTQRIVNTLSPTEGLLVIVNEEENFLYKFDINTKNVEPLGSLLAIDSYGCILSVPLLVSAELSVESCTPKDYGSLGDINVYINGISEYAIRSENVLISPLINPKDIDNMRAGYCMAAFFDYCSRKGVDPIDISQEAYRNFFKINPEIDVEKLTTVDKQMASCIKLDNEEVKSWEEDAETRFDAARESFISEYKSKYRDGVRFTITYSPWKRQPYCIAEFKESNPEQVSTYFVDEPTAEEIMDALPSYGYVELIFNPETHDFNVTVFGANNGQRLLLECDYFINEPEKYTVAPALTASTLEMMGIKDFDEDIVKSTIDFYDNIDDDIKKAVPKRWERMSNDIRQPNIFVDIAPETENDIEK